MLVMNYSQTRQNLASFLDAIAKEGAAVITRADGSKFKVIPMEEEKNEISPFSELADYSIKINSGLKKISMQEMVDILKDDQEERSEISSVKEVVVKKIM